MGLMGSHKGIRPLVHIVLIVLLAVGSVSAGIPQTINYQGRLLSSSGGVVPDGSYNIVFAVVDNPTDVSTPLWTEIHADISIPPNPVIVESGLFSVTLGSATPITSYVFEEGERWLAVRVGSDSWMTPFTELTSAAFSNHSSLADSATTVADNCIISSKIQDASIQFEDIGPNDADEGNVMKYVDGHWIAAEDDIYDASQGLVPVGSITAWAKSLTGVPQTLSTNFLECNGQVVTDMASPLYGTTIPDLNGVTDEYKRFLRGGQSSGEKGGTETHRHTPEEHNWGCCSSGYANVGYQEHIPPYYEIVWIMRIK